MEGVISHGKDSSTNVNQFDKQLSASRKGRRLWVEAPRAEQLRYCARGWWAEWDLSRRADLHFICKPAETESNLITLPNQL